jgi:hypothetical protein
MVVSPVAFVGMLEGTTFLTVCVCVCFDANYII